MGNGVYQSAITQSCATGDPNVDMVVYSVQIPGSSVALHNAFRLRAELSAYHSGGPVPVASTATIKLNGISLGEYVVPQEGTQLDVEVWRTGNTQGVFNGGALNGLSWAGGMALEIIGRSTQLGGCILQRAGVQR